MIPGTGDGGKPALQAAEAWSVFQPEGGDAAQPVGVTLLTACSNLQPLQARVNCRACQRLCVCCDWALRCMV